MSDLLNLGESLRLPNLNQLGANTMCNSLELYKAMAHYARLYPSAKLSRKLQEFREANALNLERISVTTEGALIRIQQRELNHGSS